MLATSSLNLTLSTGPHYGPNTGGALQVVCLLKSATAAPCTVAAACHAARKNAGKTSLTYQPIKQDVASHVSDDSTPHAAQSRHSALYRRQAQSLQVTLGTRVKQLPRSSINEELAAQII
jgi:hypothetical protein